MGRMGSFNANDLKKFQKELEKLDKNMDAFLQACAKELAARLLGLVIKRTPVGDYGKSYATDEDGNHVRYKSGKNKGKVKKVSVKKGGTLRRGWTSASHEEAVAKTGKKVPSNEEVMQYLNTLAVHHFGDAYVIEITNPVEYAPYVEYGHRTPDHKGWVAGHFMMSISERELKGMAPQLLEKKIAKLLRGALK